MKNILESDWNNELNYKDNSVVKRTWILVSALVLSILLSWCGHKQEIKAGLWMWYVDTVWRYINPWKPVHWATDCTRCHIPSKWY